MHSLEIEHSKLTFCSWHEWHGHIFFNPAGMPHSLHYIAYRNWPWGGWDVMVSRIACTLCMRRDDHVDIRHIRPGEKLICQEPEKCPMWARKMLVFGTLEKITLALPSITHLYQCATSACTPTCTCRKCRHLNFGGQGQTCSKAFQPNVSITNTCCMYSVYTVVHD